MTKNISIVISFLTGLGLIFLGARFLIAPETAEAGYGIHYDEQGDYSFHYIKGIRDLFTGLIICILVLTKQTKALGITLLVGTIIPIIDMLIVLNKDYNGITQAIPHISAIIVCFVFGIILLTFKPKVKGFIETRAYLKLIRSADTGNESVLEMNILPTEKTPWHYHTLFSETFEILKGTLEVGKGNEIMNLKKGDIAIIQPNEKHYYNNISKEECIVKATLNPGNKNFENSLFILKGLAEDGLASSAGTPKKFSDLALFIYLNNSRMVGFQKIAEPIFNYMARTAIKNGHLEELILKYCR
jgi:quercetin dioxygenase-like cupin family protein